MLKMIFTPVWRSVVRILIRSMIRDTYQSIPGRGTTDCFKRTNRAIKPTYAMKIDIRKFYPSAKPEHILKPHVFRIKCPRTFDLL